MLLELEDDMNQKVFNQIRIGLACNTCIENNVPCFCKVSALPSWKTVERNALTHKILAANPDTADRELRGIVKSSRRPLFDKPWIKALRERPAYRFERRPDCVFMAIDPSGGGNQSDFAMSSLVFENARHVVPPTLKHMHLAHLTCTRGQDTLQNDESDDHEGLEEEGRAAQHGQVLTTADGLAVGQSASQHGVREGEEDGHEGRRTVWVQGQHIGPGVGAAAEEAEHDAEAADDVAVGLDAQQPYDVAPFDLADVLLDTVLGQPLQLGIRHVHLAPADCPESSHPATKWRLACLRAWVHENGCVQEAYACLHSWSEWCLGLCV
jgi:hypothetical protein